MDFPPPHPSKKSSAINILTHYEPFHATFPYKDKTVRFGNSPTLSSLPSPLSTPSPHTRQDSWVQSIMGRPYVIANVTQVTCDLISDFRFPIFRFSDFPIFRFSDFPIFRFSDFPIFRFSDFPIFRFSDFPIFRFSDFPIFRFSDFPIFRFSDFPIFRFSDFPIFRFPISDFRFPISDFRFSIADF